MSTFTFDTLGKFCIKEFYLQWSIFRLWYLYIYWLLTATPKQEFTFDLLTPEIFITLSSKDFAFSSFDLMFCTMWMFWYAE